jgi:hypothetical protein
MTIIDLKGKQLTIWQILQIRDLCNTLLDTDFHINMGYVDEEDIIKLRDN